MNRWAALLAPLLLAGCGGGIYLEFTDDDPPSVNLAAGAASAAPGDDVALSAGASDDDYIYAVEFFRVDPDGDTFYLGSDRYAPFNWTAAMPSARAGETVYFYARATDSIGQQTDSERVAVTAE
jgi:hypothetical protein